MTFTFISWPTARERDDPMPQPPMPQPPMPRYSWSFLASRYRVVRCAIPVDARELPPPKEATVHQLDTRRRRKRGLELDYHHALDTRQDTERQRHTETHRETERQRETR